MPEAEKLSTELPLHQRKVIADASFFASSEGQLAQRTSMVQQRGMLLGDAYISRGDKPGGVEPGNRVYIRDKRYYAALEDIISKRFTGAVDPNLATACFIELMKKYIYEGLPTHAAQELPGIDKLMSGLFGATDKYALLTELDKLKDPATSASSKFNNLLQTFATTKIAAAQQTLATVKSKLAAAHAKNEPERAAEVYKILLSLETQNFANNPVLFEFFIQQIESHKYNVESWLIKLDFAMATGEPGVNRTDMTGTIKEQPSFLGLRRAASYLYNKYKKRDPAEVFTDPFLETAANRHAMNSGMRTQEIQVGHGSYADDSLKPVIFVRWQPGMSTLEDLATKPPAGFPALSFKGGKKYFTNVLAYQEDDGSLVSASKLFRGLGKQFANMLLQGDRDGVGKRGQNKGVVVVNDKLEFFGFDFGKAYDPAASILRDLTKLDDAFNFTQPSTNPQKALVNFHMFTDTSYSERLYGVQLLAYQQLRYQIEKMQAPVTMENVAEMQAKLGQIRAALLSHSDVTSKTLDKDLIMDPMHAFKEQVQVCQQLLAAEKDPTTIKRLNDTIARLQTTQQMAENNLTNMLAIFERRLTLTNVQADALSALESLAALPNTSVYTQGKEAVLLNHPYVEKKHRIALQLEQQDGNYVLVCDAAASAQVVTNINAYLKSINSEQTVTLQNGKIFLTADLLQHLNSEKIFGFIQNKGWQAKNKVNPADFIESTPNIATGAERAAHAVSSIPNQSSQKDVSRDMQEIAECFAMGVVQQIQELKARKIVPGQKSAKQLEVLGNTAAKLTIYIDKIRHSKQNNSVVQQRSNIMDLQGIIKETEKGLDNVGYPGAFARFMTHVAQAITSLISCVFTSDNRISHRTSAQKFKQALKFSAHKKTLAVLQQEVGKHASPKPQDMPP